MFRIMLGAVGIFLVAAGTAPAQIVPFNLAGNGGAGLLGSNAAPIPVAGGGSGGERGAGITFNSATRVMSINVGWGSGNGFTNLTGNATIGHIHGPTSSPYPGSFNAAVGVRYNLHTESGWNPSATSGGFNGTINILPSDVTGLF